MPYSPTPTWPDIANRTIYRGTVTNFIAAAHSFNMVAMNYNLYGGAYDNYLTDGSGAQLSMGIFSSTRPTFGYAQANQMNVGLPAGWATSALYEMNNRDAGWQNYIFGKEQQVFNNLPFDGWHIDSLGVHNAYDFSGVYFSLDDNNPSFINNAQAALGKRVLFNTVDAGGENQVAQYANVDFVYSELWAGNQNYSDFNRRVDNARKYGSKAPVFAAYMDRGLSSGYFNEPGVRLADAGIFACGAAHIELGDSNLMLHTEYFPDDTSVQPSASLAVAMRNYYDFLVAYQNLLRDGTVSDGNQVVLTGAPSSTSGNAGAVWLLTKKNLGYNILHLVNLANNTNTLWRDNIGTYSAPPVYSNLQVKMYYSGPLGGGSLWYATPDTNRGAATQLYYSSGVDSGGNFVIFNLPWLQYWDMVWLELNGKTSAADKVFGSAYDSMAAIGLENTADIGGGSDVCCVNNTVGGSYVAFNNIDFASGASNISARVASALANGTIEFRLDNPAGPLIAAVPVGNTGGWQTWQTVSASVSGAFGVHKLFGVFRIAPSNLNWFQFGVILTNHPPSLSPVADQSVPAGTTLSVTNSASDPDAPPQTLTFDLLSAPAGASLNASNGLFTWRPAIAHSPSTQTICLAVSDNGIPVLSATQCFSVAVSRPAQPALDQVTLSGGSLTFRISGDRGPDYTILASTDFFRWTPVFATNAPALPFNWTESDPSSPWRFYRVVLGP